MTNLRQTKDKFNSHWVILNFVMQKRTIRFSLLPKRRTLCFSNQLDTLITKGDVSRYLRYRKHKSICPLLVLTLRAGALENEFGVFIYAEILLGFMRLITFNLYSCRRNCFDGHKVNVFSQFALK